jgi:hypothetical protein
MLKLFYTDYEISSMGYRTAKEALIPKGYYAIDDALGAARLIIEKGGVPWEIKSQDGLHLSREQIRDMVRSGAFGLANRPKVY